MRLLSTVWKRSWDAVHAFAAVLLGRATTKKLTPTQRVKHAAALQNDLLEVASLLEKMHAWTSRMAARDSRAAKKILDGEPEPEILNPGAPPGSSPVLATRDRKAMLRAYVTAQKWGTGGVPPPPPPEQLSLVDANGDEPVTEEDEP